MNPWRRGDEPGKHPAFKKVAMSGSGGFCSSSVWGEGVEWTKFAGGSPSESDKGEAQKKRNTKKSVLGYKLKMEKKTWRTRGGGGQSFDAEKEKQAEVADG